MLAPLFFLTGPKGVTSKADTREVDEDRRTEGRIADSVYLDYFKSCGNATVALALVSH